MYMRVVVIKETLYFFYFVKIANEYKHKKNIIYKVANNKLQIILKYIIKMSDILIKKQSNE